MITARVEHVQHVYQGIEDGHTGNAPPLDRTIRQHGAFSAIRASTFAGMTPSLRELTPGRMHEHVIVEEVVVQWVLIMLTLLLLGAVLQGSIWLFRLRRAGAIPLLLLPSLPAILRTLGFGVLLPVVAYWCYSRLPVIGGREYGWASGMVPRFAIELLLLAVLLLWLPAHLMRRTVRRRCDELGIVMPEPKAEFVTGWIVRGGICTACILTAVTLYMPADLSPLLRVAGIILAVGIGGVSVYVVGRKRRQFGLYYGTVARSVTPVYALSILLLAGLVQPWLLSNEIRWLQQDNLYFNYLAHEPEADAGPSLLEARTAHRYAKLLQQALEDDTRPVPSGRPILGRD